MFGPKKKLQVNPAIYSFNESVYRHIFIEKPDKTKVKIEATAFGSNFRRSATPQNQGQFENNIGHRKVLRENESFILCFELLTRTGRTTASKTKTAANEFDSQIT